MPLQNILVYNFVSGATGYPHSGTFTVGIAGQVTIDDSNGMDDATFGDFTHTGGSDTNDQDVTASTVASISVGDTIDLRYKYPVTGSDGSSGTIHFTATNTASNYGPLFVSDFPLTAGVTYTFGTFNTDGAAPYSSLVICFAAGTQIRTQIGERPIEELAAGDMVLTMDHGYQPIRWIGSSKRAATGDLAPILIRKGALGNDRDLRVSPQHRMLLQGWQAEMLFGELEVLATAKSLLNDQTILRDEGGEVEYFHMLFDTHEIIYAEGCASESFHPGQQGWKALDQATRDEILTLFPQLADGNFNDYGPAARMSLKHKEGKLLGSYMAGSV